MPYGSKCRTPILSPAQHRLAVSNTSRRCRRLLHVRGRNRALRRTQLLLNHLGRMTPQRALRNHHLLVARNLHRRLKLRHRRLLVPHRQRLHRARSHLRTWSLRRHRRDLSRFLRVELRKRNVRRAESGPLKGGAGEGSWRRFRERVPPITPTPPLPPQAAITNRSRSIAKTLPARLLRG